MKKPPNDPTPSRTVSSQLHALEESCGYGDPLPNDTREALQKLIRRVPSTIIERIILLAARGNGVLAGIKFDAAVAKAALAEADEAEAVAVAAQMLARRALDHAVRLRAEVTRDASGIRTALRGYVKTTQGASLAQENDELRSIAKHHAAAAKASKTRADNAARAAVATATTNDDESPATA